MRVTDKLMAATVTSSLFKNTAQLLRTQNMISSGKRITKPSDDPLGMGKVLDHRKTLSSIDQYQRNIAHSQSWLQHTDMTLATIDTSLIRAKEIAEYQATETATELTREIAAEEIENIYDQVLQLANTALEGRYIFAGHQTDAPPFSRDGSYNATYSGDTGEIRATVGEKVDIVTNINGADAFVNTFNVFDILRDLQNGLMADDTDAISAQLESLDDALNQIVQVRAEVGAKLNRLETTENHWLNVTLNLEEMLSGIEDADLIKAMTDLVSQETAYQASLAASARMIQPSLIDFLR